MAINAITLAASKKYTDQRLESSEGGGKNEIYIGSGEMPEGYIMQIDPNGTSPSILPDVTEADNGKVLRVINGAWAADKIPNAEGVGF